MAQVRLGRATCAQGCLVLERSTDNCSSGRAVDTPSLPLVPTCHPTGRSASNQAEAEAVVSAVERLAAAGVSLGQIGVICIYRAQASRIVCFLLCCHVCMDPRALAAMPCLRCRCPPSPAAICVLCTASPQVALVRQLLDRRLPQLQAAQQRRAQQAGLAGGGSSSCEAEALALPGEEGDGEAGEEQEAAQATIQVATVDSFQACVQFTGWLDGCVWCVNAALLVGAMLARLKLQFKCMARAAFQTINLQGAECDAIILTTTVTRSSNFASGEARAPWWVGSLVVGQS